MAYLPDPQNSPDDRDKWSKLLCQTISSLCRNGMIGTEVVKIQGLIGITLCNKEVFLVDIADQFEPDDSNLLEVSHQNGSKKSLTKSLSRKRKALNPKSMKSPEDYFIENQESHDNMEYSYSNNESQNELKKSFPDIWSNMNQGEMCLPPPPPDQQGSRTTELNEGQNNDQFNSQPSYDYHNEFMQIKSENLDSVDQSVLDDAILKETTSTPTRKMRVKKEFSQTVATTKHTAELLGYQDFTPASSRPYTCRLCEASFSKRFCLANHIVTVHQVGGKYVCKQCGRQFLQRNRYMLHIEKHSTDGTKLVCPDCGKVFTVRGNYENHLKKCSGASNNSNNNSILMNNCDMNNANNNGNNILGNNDIPPELANTFNNINQYKGTQGTGSNDINIYHHSGHHGNDDNDDHNDDEDDDENNVSRAGDDVIKENVLLYDSDLEG